MEVVTKERYKGLARLALQEGTFSSDPLNPNVCAMAAMFVIAPVESAVAKDAIVMSMYDALSPHITHDSGNIAGCSFPFAQHFAQRGLSGVITWY